MFESSRQLLEIYFFRLYGRRPGVRAVHLLQDARAHLRRLQWTYDQICRSQSERTPQPGRVLPCRREEQNNIFLFHDGAPPEANPLADRYYVPAQDEDQLFLLLQSFYLTAHRIQDLISDGSSVLPGVTKFKSRGIVIARNHLIEHTDAKGGVPIYSFLTGPAGPRLRPLQWTTHEPGSEDPGLWENASEFQSDLNRSLENGISNVAPGPAFRADALRRASPSWLKHGRARRRPRSRRSCAS